MSKTINIPVVGLPLGAGSQEAEDELEYIDMPKGMETFDMPSTDLEADPEVLAGAIKILEELCQKMAKVNFDSQNFQNQIRINLQSVPVKVVKLLNETLGSGEVSIIIDSPDKTKSWQIQETIFTGLWREQITEQGKLSSDFLVVGAVPEVVITQSFAESPLLEDLPEPPANIMNAQAILAEIKEIAKEQAVKETNKPHIINLSLLPATPDDLLYIDATLGKGNSALLSRGFGNCRIGATKYKNIWWVQFFNNNDKLILNTIEITKIPEMALAAVEDFEATLERLNEWLSAIKS